jgi:hypothetical protein
MYEEIPTPTLIEAGAGGAAIASTGFLGLEYLLAVVVLLIVTGMALVRYRSRAER